MAKSEGITGGAGTTQGEQLQARAVGAGRPDITQHEWAENQHRDSIAAYLGHRGLTQYMAMAEGIPTARARLNLLNRMHRPCGQPPTKKHLSQLDMNQPSIPQ